MSDWRLSDRTFGLAVAGHGLVFVGFLQPWIAGQFGSRDRLSGLDLARLTDSLIEHGLAGEALTLPVTRVLLTSIPLAAANALLLLTLGRVQLLPTNLTRQFTLVLALPAIAVSALVLPLAVVAAADGSVIDGPGFGLFLMLGGAAMAIAAWWLTRPPSAVTTGPIEADAGEPAVEPIEAGRSR